MITDLIFMNEITAEIVWKESTFLGASMFTPDYRRVRYSDGWILTLDLKMGVLTKTNDAGEAVATAKVSARKGTDLTNIQGRIEFKQEWIEIERGFFGGRKFTGSVGGQVSMNWIKYQSIKTKSAAKIGSDFMAIAPDLAGFQLNEMLMRAIMAIEMASLDKEKSSI